MKRKGRTTKKKRNIQHHRTLFPILLAALCSDSHNGRLIKKCLNKVFLSLPHVHLSPFLSLLPALLKFNCTEIVCKSLEIIGAASLASLEMNEKIALEDDTVKGLISLLGSSKREVAVAACNALLDLSTTSIGRQQLLEFSATENLLLCLIQESKTPAAVVSLAADMTLLGEDECRILLLQGAIALINSCTIEQLQHIPSGLSEIFSVLLKILWGESHKQQLCSTPAISDQVNKFCMSNISINSLAESIFRLSFNYGRHLGSVDLENVEKNIFGLGTAGIEQFLSEIWEVSPMLIRNASKASIRQDIIFSPFFQYLGPKEEIPTFLPSMLKSTISCPAIAADELEILNVINEIKNHLGCPIIYHQDIRVVKTQGESESHYFQNKSISSCSLAPNVLSIDDIMKCEEAFKQGYTIAVRGMEFRFQSIAAIADVLASLFGLPSAGVNMYLTPSNSQGLARHSDDHCVFVCQLIGEKRWTIFPQPDFQLPRLYEAYDSSCDLGKESHEIGGCQHFLLKEGDILYIPRGFPHEARTAVAADENVNNNTEFSLHLTLAIEIEPPFEWEGFMQIALYCWDKKEEKLQYKHGDFVLWNLHVASIGLLHIAIKLIGNLDPRFRKACLVGATPLSFSSANCLINNQTTIFRHLISVIASESKFLDALKHLEEKIQRNEDPLEHVRWMKHLTVGGETERSHYLNISSADSCSLFNLLIQHRVTAEAVFMQVKSEFCNDVEFQDVEQHYKVLLEKYRKVRKQFCNGMLSLHSAHSLSFYLRRPASQASPPLQPCMLALPQPCNNPF